MGFDCLACSQQGVFWVSLFGRSVHGHVYALFVFESEFRRRSMLAMISLAITDLWSG